MNGKSKLRQDYFLERLSGIAMNINRAAFLTFTVMFILFAAGICFLELYDLHIHPLLQNTADFFGRILLFPAITMVLYKVNFPWIYDFFPFWFTLGLLLNCVFYGFLFERLITWTNLIEI